MEGPNRSISNHKVICIECPSRLASLFARGHKFQNKTTNYVQSTCWGTFPFLSADCIPVNSRWVWGRCQVRAHGASSYELNMQGNHCNPVKAITRHISHTQIIKSVESNIIMIHFEHKQKWRVNSTAGFPLQNSTGRIKPNAIWKLHCVFLRLCLENLEEQLCEN